MSQRYLNVLPSEVAYLRHSSDTSIHNPPQNSRANQQHVTADSLQHVIATLESISQKYLRPLDDSEEHNERSVVGSTAKPTLSTSVMHSTADEFSNQGRNHAVLSASGNITQSEGSVSPSDHRLRPRVPLEEPPKYPWTIPPAPKAPLPRMERKVLSTASVELVKGSGERHFTEAGSKSPEMKAERPGQTTALPPAPAGASQHVSMKMDHVKKIETKGDSPMRRRLLPEHHTHDTSSAVENLNHPLPPSSSRSQTASAPSAPPPPVPSSAWDEGFDDGDDVPPPPPDDDDAPPPSLRNVQRMDSLTSIPPPPPPSLVSARNVQRMDSLTSIPPPPPPELDDDGDGKPHRYAGLSSADSMLSIPPPPPMSSSALSFSGFTPDDSPPGEQNMQHNRFISNLSDLDNILASPDESPLKRMRSLRAPPLAAIAESYESNSMHAQDSARVDEQEEAEEVHDERMPAVTDLKVHDNSNSLIGSVRKFLGFGTSAAPTAKSNPLQSPLPLSGSTAVASEASVADEHATPAARGHSVLQLQIDDAPDVASSLLRVDSMLERVSTPHKRKAQAAARQMEISEIQQQNAMRERALWNRIALVQAEVHEKQLKVQQLRKQQAQRHATATPTHTPAVRTVLSHTSYKPHFPAPVSMPPKQHRSPQGAVIMPYAASITPAAAHAPATTLPISPPTSSPPSPERANTRRKLVSTWHKDVPVT